MIADRRSQIAIRSAIVCDHMETYFCDRLRSCDHDRRRSQKKEHKGWFPYDRGSQMADRNKVCDRLRSYGNILLRSSAITIAEDRTALPRSRCCLLFSLHARVYLTFPLTKTYGYGRLCDRCDYMETAFFAIVCDCLRSAIVCDHMQTRLYIENGSIFCDRLHDRRRSQNVSI